MDETYGVPGVLISGIPSSLGTSMTFQVGAWTVGVSEPLDGLELPGGQVVLAQNLPNPFNPRTEINFQLGETGYGYLRVFNLRGELIRTLLSGTITAGPHKVFWNGVDDHHRQVGSGIYFYRLEIGELVETRRMVLIR